VNVYLTIDELAEALKCSRRKLHDMRKARQLPKPVIVGGTPMWLAHEVDEHLANCRGEW
jgi:predicted DNA-binding transcriptional regulator AlpA